MHDKEEEIMKEDNGKAPKLRTVLMQENELSM